MASRVELQGIHKHYDEVHVVKGVDLDVHPGEFLVLVGPSGCGKSTCLRMIAGLEDISEGELRIDGQRVNERPPKDRDIGMVFQSYALYPHKSVYENIAFGLVLRKVPKEEIRTRVQEVADQLGLQELLDRKPSQLSGGQRQRVAMGRAIARRPKVYLFDEPLSNLDAALRVQMRAELGALHRSMGVTMIYVTHDQVEAMTLADRIAVLHEGVLQQVGTPAELFHAPANRFVAGFIGMPSMNFFEGEVRQERFSTAEFSQEVGTSLEGKATVGVRPQDLHLGEQGIPGQVQLVEALGWEAYVHVLTAAGTLVARVQGSEVESTRPGDEVCLDLSNAPLHVFDAQGRRA